MSRAEVWGVAQSSLCHMCGAKGVGEGKKVTTQIGTESHLYYTAQQININEANIF